MVHVVRLNRFLFSEMTLTLVFIIKPSQNFLCLTVFPRKVLKTCGTYRYPWNFTYKSVFTETKGSHSLWGWEDLPGIRS